MASEAQFIANRLNAQKSTGPRTAEGKAAASLNAVQHGLRAQAVVLPGEGPDEYRLHRERLLADLRPQDLPEMDLAERIVELAWRLRRAGQYHSAVFEALYEQQAAAPVGEADGADATERVLGRMLLADFSGPRVLERVQLYERRIESSLFRARAEWDRRRVRPQGLDRGQSIALAGPGGAACPVKPIGAKPADAQGGAGTDQLRGITPAAQPQPTVNKQSQWQPPVVGGLGTAWTNEANFEDPIGILAAGKRLARRCAV
jgi:hypothetical protein